MRKKANLDSCAERNFTPLHVAAQNGYPLPARMLLKYGANPRPVTSGGFTPLHTASYWGENEVVVLLFPDSDTHAVTNNGFSALHLASQEGHLPVVTTLLTTGKANPFSPVKPALNATNLNTTLARHLALANKHEAVANLLAKYEMYWQEQQAKAEVERKEAGEEKEESREQQKEILKRIEKEKKGYKASYREINRSYCLCPRTRVLMVGLSSLSPLALQQRNQHKSQLIQLREKRNAFIKKVNPSRSECVALGLDPDGFSSDEEYLYSREQIQENYEQAQDLVEELGAGAVIELGIWLVCKEVHVGSLLLKLGKHFKYASYALEKGETAIKVLQSKADEGGACVGRKSWCTLGTA